ncbi:Pentafunctional AROM polypeptide [Hondaea fermentalgiana]|uniref:shikimate kinase n=1 Tax=Hondaea fermentalgiana TaxID=2315210 RepID=A0A2R5GHH6_9STRA|nr:Pentafunctional AROM polypeptide [Hondaea fermentalgiana]|eukprot:GBG27741.1 Pentafunctional AROM polypeptide [Hondaea fermentalgiana]
MGESVVVVGMRGAGKSTLGRVGATVLGYAFIDMDEELERDAGKSCGDIVAAEGWDGFRRLELEAFEKVLAAHPQGAVISCGGGIVETEPARERLQMLQAVIFVDRHIKDIVAELEAKEAANQSEVEDSQSLARRPKYGAGIEEVYQRRLPWFLACATHRFCIGLEDREWDRVSAEFTAFARSLFFAPEPSALVPNSRLHLACSATEVGKLAAAGADGVWLGGSELVEQWPAKLAMARRRTALPVIVDAGQDDALAVMGLRLSAEAVAVDSAKVMESALRTVSPRWFGTTVFAVRVAVKNLSSAASIEASLDAFCAGVSSEHASRIALLIVTAPRIADALEATRLVTALERRVQAAAANSGGNALPKLQAFMLDVARCEGEGVPLAQALASGRCGPALLPLSPAAAVQLREALPVFPERHFCLIGGSVRSSPSPSMHNAGFRALGLPARYTLCETMDGARIQTTLETERFRGASVTMPHKELVLEYMDTLSDAAKRIGAINTVIKSKTDELHGDNTDWFGLYQLCKAGLAARKENPSETQSRGKALLLGAGGTALAAAYCIEQLGLDLVVWNRSTARAEALVSSFPGTVLADLEGFSDPVDLIIGTVPASSGLRMPDEGYLREHQPVVVDVAYRPRQTELLKQAASCGCITYEGIDMLVEQGLMQMALWTGKPVEEVPRIEMETAARNFYADTDPACERYYLFGHPIRASPSPTLHNQGFQALRMTRHYALCESLDIDVVARKVQEPSFRGASVTIPHKEAVAPLLNNLTPAAEAIGAVNTIIRKEDASLLGDNTDWQGIRALLARSPRLSQLADDGAGPAVVLVVGAGGTALAASYCVVQMGLQLIVYNRTFSKAATVAERFGGAAVQTLEELPAVDCIISTVPSGAGFEAPTHLLASKPAVVDVAYRPRRTKLLQQAETHGCETYEGIEMLVEQGLVQFQLWTGCDAPRARVEEAVYKFYEESEV